MCLSNLIYNCIECRKPLDLARYRNKSGSVSLTCNRCKIPRDKKRSYLEKIINSRAKNYVIDEYFVRNDLRKDSFIYCQLFKDS